MNRMRIMTVNEAAEARFPFKRKRLRFLRFSFTQRTQRKRLRLNENRAWRDPPRQQQYGVWVWIIAFSLGSCESEIFVRIESRIESGCSRLRVQCRLPRVVYRPIYMYFVLLGTLLRCNVLVILVPQTILHDRSYSASECVFSCYINIKSLS